MKTLQESGYVAVAKSFQNNRPLTTLALTAGGEKAFRNYVALLAEIVEITRQFGIEPAKVPVTK